MKVTDIFDLLGKEFPKAEIPYLLIGGFAVNMYHVTRQTNDVDILMTEETYAKARSLLENTGYKEMAKGDLFARFASEKSSLMDLDILFVDSETFKGMAKESKETQIRDLEFKVPSLQHLMAMKLHALKNNPNREMPDLMDLVNLIKINKIDVQENSFQELCAKYGSKDCYERIKNLVKNA